MAHRSSFSQVGITRVSQLCPSCNVEKLAQYFPLDRGRPSGLYVYCRDCTSYKTSWQNAKKYDKKFSFNTCTKEEYYKVMELPCYYCGLVKVTGVDRIDNYKGHEVDNILPCCEYCNVARSNHFTVEETLKHIGPAIRAIRESRQVTTNNLPL